MKELKIVNVIHIGDQEIRWSELSPEEKRDIAQRLNEQALTQMGYRKVQRQTA